MEHIPVMLNEAIKYLNIKKDGVYIDCTFGSGGHSLEIIKNLSSDGKLFVLDLDYETEKLFIEKFGVCSSAQPDNSPNIETSCRVAGESCQTDMSGGSPRYEADCRVDETCQTGMPDGSPCCLSDDMVVKNAKFICSNFAELPTVVKKYNIKKIDGVLFDFGFSSLQIGNHSRGFSFNFEAPLDMRYNKNNSLTADKIVNTYEEKELVKIFSDFGDEQFAPKIARAISIHRMQKKISTTLELVEIIRCATPHWYHKRKIHFATKAFQALRIAVNGELENIEKGVLLAINLVSSTARIITISFHSIEHRLLKNIFKEAVKNNFVKLIEKKPVFPQQLEKLKNPRSRSAQMRIVEKI
ncbi:MAG: 16S rRNA (cytosine(1402)-N(4))-methyltransferase RsmH [Elusimicrobiota bacterium]